MLRRLMGCLLLGLWAQPATAACQQDPHIGAIVDPIVAKAMKEDGIPGAAFVFVRGDCVVYAKAYGVSDLARGEAVSVDKTVWPIASITKLMTATAAMQLVGEGKLALDADVNRALKRLAVPGTPPVTLRHLLSHSAGLDELPGRQFDGHSLPDLAAFLKTRLVRYRPPGLRTAYSSYAIALTGLMVEEASGESYADYVRHHIFLPAGMTGARVMRIRGDEKGVATPYRLDDGRALPMPYEWYVTEPTSSVAATASDMARFIRLQLGDGLIAGRRIVPAALAREMRKQQATIHPALPGWGLGFQLDRVNGVAIAEHGGDIGGFSALLSLMPERHAGFFIVNHGESNDLRFKVKAALLDALYPAKAAAVPKARPDPVLRAYAGRYLSSIACQTCKHDESDVFTVAANEDGTLSVWGHRWTKLGRDLFVSEDGRRLLGFARDAKGKIDTMSGGSWRVANRL